jgi:hypothetical protein
VRGSEITKEGEDQKRTALQLMQRDRERIAQPKGARDEKSRVARQEESGDVGAPRGA